MDQINAPCSTRIAYFISNPHAVTGSHRSLLQLLENLPPEIEPIVVAPVVGLCLDYYADRGVSTTVIPTPEPLHVYNKGLLAKGHLARLWLFIRYVLPYSLRFARFLKEESIDLVHCNDTRALLLVGPGARLARRPLVCHIRGMFPFDGALRLLPQLISNRLIIVAETLRGCIAPYFRSKAVTVYNAVDRTSFDTPSTWEPSLPEFFRGQEPTGPVLGVLATVLPAKGIHQLLEAIALLQGQEGCDEPSTLIAGDTPDAMYMDHLRSLMKRWELQGVRFLGYRSDPENVYRQADIFVISSVPKVFVQLEGRTELYRSNEGLPRTAIEAMYFGKPVVTTDIAGASEAVLDGITGMVVPANNPEQLAGALATLIRDPAQRAAMGKAGFERCNEMFSTQSMVKRNLRVYRNLGLSRINASEL